MGDSDRAPRPLESATPICGVVAGGKTAEVEGFAYNRRSLRSWMLPSPIGALAGAFKSRANRGLSRVRIGGL